MSTHYGLLSIIKMDVLGGSNELNLEQMPLDILAEICGHLKIEDIVRGFASSNKALRRVLEYEEMWRLMLPVYFSSKGLLRAQRELDAGQFQFAFRSLYKLYVPTARLSQVMDALEQNVDQSTPRDLPSRSIKSNH